MAVWLFFSTAPTAPKKPIIQYHFNRFLYLMIGGTIYLAFSQFLISLCGEAAYCPGSQLVPIFHLPLNGVPKLAAVFKLLKTAASFKNGLSYL